MQTFRRRLLVTASIIAAFTITYFAFAPGSLRGTAPTEPRAALAQEIVATTQPAPAPAPATAVASVIPAPAAAPDYTPEPGVDHLAAGRSLYWQGDFETACIEFERAARQRPGTYMPHYLLGLSYQRVGEVDLAEREYVAAKEIDGDRPEALINLARLYMMIDEAEEAFELAAQATEVAPDNDSAWNQLGRAHLARGEHEPSIAAFEEACRLDDQNAYAWNNLGYAHIQNGSFDQALVPLETALSIRTDKGYMHNNLGVVLEQLDRLEEAMVAYAQAAEIDPLHSAAAASAERLAAIVPEAPVVADAGGPEVNDTTTPTE